MFDFSGLMRRYAWLRIRKIERTQGVVSQERLLARLVSRAKSTKFGRAHGFAALSGVEAFQRSIRPRRFEDFWNESWKTEFPDLVNCTWPGKIRLFAMTSGTTTGHSKYIPYTIAMRRAAVRGFVDLLCYHLVRNPESHLFGGAALALAGPTTLESTEGNAATGAVSAITAQAAPGFLRHRLLPPPELAELTDWKEKISKLAPLSLEGDVRMLGGSPNWLLLFLNEVARVAPGGGARLVDWFPELELVAHGGISFAPYRHRFQELLQGGHAETRELYSASEGVFAYADRGDGEGLRLHLDGQVFFEFVPVEELSNERPARHWLANVELGQDYALAISTAAGLWSYLVGDTVRFVTTDPPRLVVTGRTGADLSAFGEHLIEHEIAAAIAGAGKSMGLDVLDYTVGAVRDGKAPRHVFYIEAGSLPEADRTATFSSMLDQGLREENLDYRELREAHAFAAPEARFVPPGGFAHWMELRRALGGQNKVPRIVRDEALFADLANCLEQYISEARQS